MDYNIIRNYNEITNNGTKRVEKYSFKKGVLVTDEDRDACLRLLILDEKHEELCHNYYSAKYFNSVIEDSDWLLYFHEESKINAIVAFALVKLRRKKKGRILDIRLLCAVQNHRKFGQMMANAVYNFAIERGCLFIYTSPRTEMLRKTFIKYGFEPIYGKINVDEVLEKELDSNIVISYNRTKTRKIYRKNLK